MVSRLRLQQPCAPSLISYTQEVQKVDYSPLLTVKFWMEAFA